VASKRSYFEARPRDARTQLTATLRNALSNRWISN